MDDVFAILMALAMIGTVIGGAICGIVAVVQLRRLRTRIEALEARALPSSTAKAASQPASSAISTEPAPVISPPPVASKPITEPEYVAPPVPAPNLQPSDKETASWTTHAIELAVGGRWMGWVGILFVLMGTVFGLKYAYDNQYIGPAGRLAIGMLAGTTLLGFGEYMRKRGWQAIAQIFTGGGVAAFYICVYFAHHVYGFIGPTAAIGLASVVTLGSVVLAVAYDAPTIAVLALAGGFLSPVLLGSAENRPYALFGYVAALDLIAVGAAYFRRWRAVDLLSLMGTTLLYQAWFTKFHATPDVNATFLPSLLFTTFFYALFLVIPILHAIATREGDSLSGLALIVADSLIASVAYYNILFPAYRHALGFVILGQASLVLGLYWVWSIRISRTTRTAQSLLVIAMALIAIAIPLQLAFYGVPLAWAAQGVVLTYLGLRFKNWITHASGLAVLILAAGRLLMMLPMHQTPFRVILNAPFGSWFAIVLAAACVAWLQWRDPDRDNFLRLPGMLLAAFLAYALACLAVTEELYDAWTHSTIEARAAYRASSMAMLWAIIPWLTLRGLSHRTETFARLFVSVIYGIGAFALLISIDQYAQSTAGIPFLGTAFLCRAVFLAALWMAGRHWRANGFAFESQFYLTAAHVMLAILSACEVIRWADAAESIDNRIGVSLVSAIWALQACGLIWLGLQTRSRLWRYLGFILFGLTIAKTLLLDMATLEKVYRIISFLGSGVFLLAAATFYNRYAPRLLERDHATPPDSKP